MNFFIIRLIPLHYTCGYILVLAILKMAHEWPKRVGWYYIINLYSYTKVHLLVFLKILRYLLLLH